MVTITRTVEAAFTSDPLATSPTWTDISAWLKEGSTQRGRPGPFDRFQPGRATLVFDNSDRRFDPDYASSPYNGGLAPGKRMRIRVTYVGDNLLTYNQSSLETDLTGWANDYNATVARSTLFAADGRASMSLTRGGFVDVMIATTPTGVSGIACSSSTQYSAVASFRSAATSRNVKVGIAWYTSAGVHLSDSYGSVAADSTTAWTQVTVTATSPGTAAFMAVKLHVAGPPAASEVHYADKVIVRAGSDTTWAPGYGTFGIFDGYVDDEGWQTEFRQASGTATVTLTDAFKLFADKTLPSVYEQTVRAEGTLTGWWRLGDALGSTKAADSYGTAHGATSTATWGTEGSVYGDSDNAATLGDGVSISFPNKFSGTSSWSVEFRLKTAAVGDMGIMGNIAYASRYWLLVIDSNGKLRAEIKDSVAGTGVTVTSSTVVNDSLWHHIVVTRDSADNFLRIYDNGTLVGTSAATTISLQATRWLAGPVSQEISVDEIATYSSALSAASAGFHTVAATIPWQDDTEATRVGRVLDYIGWPVASRDLDAGQSVLARSDAAGTALEQMQKAAESARALMFMTGDGKVRLVDRHSLTGKPNYTTAQAAYGDQSPELNYFSLTTSAAELVNEARVTAQDSGEQIATDSASVAAYGPGSRSFATILRDPLEAADQAAYIVMLNAEPRRVPAISVWPYHDDNRLWAEILRREIGDRVSVTSRPLGVGSATTWQVYVSSIAHRFSDVRWETSYTYEAADTNTYLTLDDPVAGLLDSTPVLGY